VLLYSLGKDRRLCELNLTASLLAEGLTLSSRVVVEQRALPTAMVLLPNWGDEQFLLTASRANKLRLVNSATKMCRRVVMGPRLEEPPTVILPLAGSFLRGSNSSTAQPGYG
jgi:hypothetical protein